MGRLRATGAGPGVAGSRVGVRASRPALGATTPRILFFHVVPTTLPALSVQATLGMGGAILAEASLSFLGLGVAADAQLGNDAQLRPGARARCAAPHGFSRPRHRRPRARLPTSWETACATGSTRRPADAGTDVRGRYDVLTASNLPFESSSRLSRRPCPRGARARNTGTSEALFADISDGLRAGPR